MTSYVALDVQVHPDRLRLGEILDGSGAVFAAEAGIAPVTEQHPLIPETGYALAKTLCEKTASEMNRWSPATQFVGLRISNIFRGA
jgi:nucleoside-diphosphate-sugar epimerase